MRQAGIIFLLLLCVASCMKSPLDDVQQMVNLFNFESALIELRELDPDIRGSDEGVRLETYALLAEGRLDEGFWKIHSALKTSPDNQEEFAQIILDAAGVVIRESSRSFIAVALLDSCIKFDPNRKTEVLKLAWDRSLEYLKVKGDAGFRLLEFANKHDPQTISRLKSSKRVLARRYDEMVLVRIHLQSLDEQAAEFRQKFGRYPSSLKEMAQKSLDGQLASSRQGWDVKMIILPDGAIGFQAEALRNNQGKVPAGTIMLYP